MQFDTSWRPVVRVREGELMPPLHGVAYTEWSSYTLVTAVIPLNWVIGTARSFWAFLRHGSKRVSSNPREAYLQGRRDGRR